LYVLSAARRALQLHRLPLAGGVRQQIELERATHPHAPVVRSDAHMWYSDGDHCCGGPMLRLWGGLESVADGKIPGFSHAISGQAPLGELWELHLSSPARWFRPVFDGGGCPPPLRGEASVAALPGG
jgi:hypothetical protein